jgi:class 3 adenylate cyclase
VAEREVRYCTTSDGVRIAYCVEGDGPPLLIIPPIWTASSLMHELPGWDDFVGRISKGRTLITLDSRGTGLSQRESVNDASVLSFGVDAMGVLDAAGLPRCTLMVSGPLGPAAISCATVYPERCSGLILIGSWARITETPREILRPIAALARANWKAAARTIAGWNLRRGLADAASLASIYFRSTEGEWVARTIEENLDTDVTAMLGQVQARTLVIHAEDDPFYPFSEARLMSAQIPNARFLPIAGNISVSSLGDRMELVVDAITSFLDLSPETRAIEVERPVSPSMASAFRAVLFTDLVGHTEMMSRLGDNAGRDILREHERITREVLKANGGTEVKTMGDGFMASFGSVTKAVECAVALQRAFADREGEPLNVRVGLNAGEPIEEDGDLFGATVILASRIAAKAGGGEILVADTVRGLCSGKGFLFADRGEFVAKGIEEPVRISQVSWRNDI